MIVRNTAFGTSKAGMSASYENQMIGPRDADRLRRTRGFPRYSAVDGGAFWSLVRVPREA